MGSEDLLAVANTSLQLGDWFYPPVGATIVLVSRGVPVTPACRMVRRNGDDDGFTLMFPGGVPWRAAKGYPYLLIELPADCPLFEQWERPREE